MGSNSKWNETFCIGNDDETQGKIYVLTGPILGLRALPTGAPNPIVKSGSASLEMTLNFRESILRSTASICNLREH